MIWVERQTEARFIGKDLTQVASVDLAEMANVFHYAKVDSVRVGDLVDCTIEHPSGRRLQRSFGDVGSFTWSRLFIPRRFLSSSKNAFKQAVDAPGVDFDLVQMDVPLRTRRALRHAPCLILDHLRKRNRTGQVRRLHDRAPAFVMASKALTWPRPKLSVRVVGEGTVSPES